MRGHPLVVASLLLVACAIFDTSGGGGTAGSVGGTQGSSGGSASTDADTSSSDSTSPAASSTGTTLVTAGATTSGDPSADETSAPTGDPKEVPYSDCFEDGTCMNEDELCIEYIDAARAFVGRICVPSCEADSDCPVPETGVGLAFCSRLGVCQLDCDRGLQCPDGMSCVDTNLGRACAYPPQD
jgi:hypothetical protein